VTRAATAVFMGTAPYGITNKGMEVARVRLACAYPGDQPSQFSEAIRRLHENAAYLDSRGDTYWFSPIPSLNQEAEDRAKALSTNEVDAEIVTLVRAEERHKGTGGFHRVHAAPDDPLGIDDALEAALVILPPTATHSARDSTSAAMALASDIIERKGTGQRRNRNRLAFLALDHAALEDVRNVVRKKLAWASIAKDGPGLLQLPPTQQKDSEKRRDEQNNAAETAVRRSWKHLILPQRAQPDSPNVARGFDLEAQTLSSKSTDPAPLAQLAWTKCEQDGLIVSKLGGAILDKDLDEVWQADRPHLPVRQIRDWFAQFPYLSKLRDPLVLANAINDSVARTDARYGLAESCDEGTGNYNGLKLAHRSNQIDLNSDALLVRRAVAEAQLAIDAPPSVAQVGSNLDSIPTTSIAGVAGSGPIKPAEAGATSAPVRPKRFYAKIILDPNRPTPQVSNIAQSILSELERMRGTAITLTLDIDAENPGGFSADTVNVVRDNAASLRILDFGFEGD